MLHIGVIGTGRMGRMRVESIQKYVDNAKVIAVADPYLNAESKEWADRSGIPHFYKDYTELLEDSMIDAVCICTPTDMHYPISLAALYAGKHVLCEKPIDHNLNNAKTLCETVEKTGLKYQIAFNRRFDHNYTALRKLIKDQTLGDIYLLRIPARDKNIPPYNYIEHSGGMFFDFQIHDFDMVRYLLGSEVTEVFAWGDTLIDPGLKAYNDIDTALISLRMETGALAIIDASRHSAAQAPDRRAEVSGTKGQAAIFNDRISNVTVSGINGITGERPVHNFLLRFKESFYAETAAFVYSISEDKPVPVSCIDGYKAMQIAMAANNSLSQNRPVKLSEITI